MYYKSKTCGMSRTKKGVAELVVALIIIALSAFTTASLHAVSKHISEDIVTSISNPNAYVKIINNEITVFNPTPTPVPLSEIKLVVNGELIPINDSNNNNIWDPYESIKLSIPTDKDVITISLYVEGRLVYDAIYVKPSVIQYDKEFPKVNVNIIKPKNANDVGALRVEISASDDLSLATRTVYLGEKDGDDVLFCYKNIITEKEVYGRKGWCEGEKEGWYKNGKSWFSEITKGLGIGKTPKKEFEKFLTETIEFKPSDLKNAEYIRIVVKDLSGKTSSKIISLKQYIAPVLVVIEYPHNGDEFWQGEKIHVKAKATYALGIKLLVDGKNVKTQKCDGISCELETDLDKLSLGKHEIKAIAWNAINTAKDKVKIKVIKDDPPSIEIIEPKDGSEFYTTTTSAKVHVKANATDDHGIRKVVFEVGSKQCIDTSAPYECDLEVGLGKHTITAIAYDTRNQKAESSITITVEKDSPPTVKITQPTNGATVGSSFDIVADASDDRGVISVTFYIDDSKVCEDRSTPYICKVAGLASGTHTIKAVAKDIVGQTAVDSISVTVDVAPSVKIIKPDSSIVKSPSNPAKFDIVVEATDDFGVSKVVVRLDGKEFVAYSGDPLKSVVTSVTVSASKGKHKITAIAYDTRNQQGSTTKAIEVGIISAPKVKILDPENGAKFVPRDPPIIAVSKNALEHTTTLGVNNKTLSSITSKIISENRISTGWTLVSNGDVIALPKLGSGKVKLTIQTKRVSNYLPTATIKPFIKKGIGDSKGASIVLDLPSSAVVRIKMMPISGPVEIYKAYSGIRVGPWWSFIYVAESYAMTAPEGARIVEAKLSKYMHTRESFSSVSVIVGIGQNPPDVNIDNAHSIPNTVGERLVYKIYYLSKYPYRGYPSSLTAVIDLPRDKIQNALDKGYLINIVTHWWYETHANPANLQIKYITTVKYPTILLDGREIYHSWAVLSKPEQSVVKTFTVGKGHHVLTLKSSYGAFRYIVEVIPTPESSNANSITLVTPTGAKITVPIDGSCTVVLSSVGGTYKVLTQPSSARALVNVILEPS